MPYIHIFFIFVYFTRGNSCSHVGFKNEIVWLVWLERVNIGLSKTHMKGIGKDILTFG